jgi:hypothetical protein
MNSLEWNNLLPLLYYPLPTSPAVTLPVASCTITRHHLSWLIAVVVRQSHSEH